MSDSNRFERKADDDFERFWEEMRAQGSQVAGVVSKDVARALFRGGWFAGGTHTANQLNIEYAMRHPLMRRTD